MEFVQIYSTNADKISIITVPVPVPIFCIFLLLLNFSLLDPNSDPEGKINADPDPQPC